MRIMKANRGLPLLLALGIAITSGCGPDGDTGKWLGVEEVAAPTVLFTLPTSNEVDVATNSLVSATFSEEMDPASVNTTTFLIKNGTKVILGSVEYTGVTAVFTPSVDLLSNTEYSATITLGALSMGSGKSLDYEYIWKFRTAGPSAGNPDKGTDRRPPVVTSTVPANLATAVAINTSVTVTFNEAMNPLTLTTTSFTLYNGPTAISGTVNPIGSMAVFTPNLPLNFSTVYTATVTTLAEDLAGNKMQNDYVWTFTTGAVADITPPTVILTAPVAGATGVPISTTVVATFSEAMNPLTLTTTSFTLYNGPTAISGTVNPTVLTAVFMPNIPLSYNTTYTATVTTLAKDLAGNPMVADFVWTFKTVTAPVPPPAGLLDPYAIASAGGVTTGAALVKINGSTVLAPNDQCNTVPLGFTDNFGACGANAPLNNNPGVLDFVITPTHPAPGPVTSAQIIAELNTKWNSLSPAGMPGGTVLGCGTIGSAGDAGALIGCNGNFTLPPGVYISSTGSSIGISGNLVLDGGGDPNALFVFQSPSSTLVTAPTTTIILQNGAKASNVWWYVGSSATLGTNTAFKGNILASASISMGTGATSCGRLLSGASGAGAFTFLGNTVSVPGHANAPAGCN